MRLVVYPVIWKRLINIQHVGFLAGFLNHQQYHPKKNKISPEKMTILRQKGWSCWVLLLMVFRGQLLGFRVSGIFRQLLRNSKRMTSCQVSWGRGRWGNSSVEWHGRKMSSMDGLRLKGWMGNWGFRRIFSFHVLFVSCSFTCFTWRIMTGQTQVVNNHGNRFRPPRIWLWDPCQVAFPWLINGGWCITTF